MELDLVDAGEAPEPFRALAASVGLVVPTVESSRWCPDFRRTPSLVARPTLVATGTSYRVSADRMRTSRVAPCSTNPWLEEWVVAPTCAATAFVVGPRWILTARHVVCPDVECKQNLLNQPGLYFVLGWAGALELAGEGVYHIERLRDFGRSTDDDWALLEVDRPFASHQRPLSLADAPPVVGQSVHALAHPLGTALKYASNGKVVRVGTTIVSDIDSLSGFSGAPLLDDQGRVVGLSFRGPTYTSEGDCRELAVGTSLANVDEWPSEAVPVTRFASAVAEAAR